MKAARDNLATLGKIRTERCERASFEAWQSTSSRIGITLRIKHEYMCHIGASKDAILPRKKFTMMLLQYSVSCEKITSRSIHS